VGSNNAQCCARMGSMAEQKLDQANTIVGTHCCATLGPRITLDQKRSEVIVEIHCCARRIWARISTRMAEDATMTYIISARMNLEAKVNRDHISARTTCVMWPEERLWNVGVLQRVRLFKLVAFGAGLKVYTVPDVSICFSTMYSCCCYHTAVWLFLYYVLVLLLPHSSLAVPLLCTRAVATTQYTQTNVSSISILWLSGMNRVKC
jgi:hypothetical protein